MPELETILNSPLFEELASMLDISSKEPNRQKDWTGNKRSIHACLGSELPRRTVCNCRFTATYYKNINKIGIIF